MVAHTFRLVSAATAVGALVASSAALADDEFPNELAQRPGAEQLQPLSQWNLAKGEESCRLMRLFGPDGERHFLMIEQAAPGQAFGLTLAGPSLSRFRTGSRTHIGMEGDAPMVRFDMPPMGQMDEFGSAVILPALGLSDGTEDDDTRWLGGSLNDVGEAEERQIGSASVDLARAAQVERIVLKRGGTIVSFETGNLSDPFEALNGCTSEMLTGWGLDPEKHRTYLPPRWINQEEIVARIEKAYPQSALVRGEQAIFRMRVIVDEQGDVAECHIDAVTSTERLESPACAEMMSARFEPALDAQGKPMRTFFSTSISYRVNG
jgi:hypothetical protein